MTFKPKLSPFQAAQLVVDISNGMSRADAMKKYKVSHSTVLRYIRLDRQNKEEVPRYLQPCGTDAGYRQHLRVPEPPCIACNAAHALKELTYKYNKKRAELERVIREDLGEVDWSGEAGSPDLARGLGGEVRGLQEQEERGLHHHGSALRGGQPLEHGDDRGGEEVRSEDRQRRVARGGDQDLQGRDEGAA